MISIEELKIEVAVSLRAFRIDRWQEFVIGKNVSFQFVIEQFGVIVCTINPDDRAFVENKLKERFRDWRFVFVSTLDNMAEAKDEILWALMRSGYMKWLRYTYEREYKYMFNTTNIARKIVDKRLEVWGAKEKYKFLVEDTIDGMKQPISRLISTEPAFFDEMPEEEN